MSSTLSRGWRTYSDIFPMRTILVHQRAFSRMGIWASLTGGMGMNTTRAITPSRPICNKGECQVGVVSAEPMLSIYVGVASWIHTWEGGRMGVGGRERENLWGGERTCGSKAVDKDWGYYPV